MTNISQQYVRECLDYDPDTGVLTWRKRPIEHFATYRSFMSWNGKNAGKAAGRVDEKDGYMRAKCGWVNHLVHRLIWFHQTGDWPEETDHINHVRTDNRWSNLRSVSKSENGKNQKKKSNNTSGVTGVCFRDGRWVAQVCSRSGQRFYKRYDSFDEAAQSVLLARQDRNFHENHGEQHVV